MYAAPQFEEVRPEANHELIRNHPLGLLVTHDPAAGFEANLLPFLLDSTAGPLGTLRAHLARNNPHWRMLAGARCLVVFQGPQGYVTPNWYPTKAATGRVVPTWNYATVQATGSATVIDDPAWLRAHVSAATAFHERGQDPPWRVADAPDEFIESMLRGIVGIEIPIEVLTGKWKMSQNRPQEDIEGVVAGFTQNGDQALAAAISRVRPRR